MVSLKLVSVVVGFSLLVVWSHWNVFSSGVYALGLNFSLFWIGFAALIYYLDDSYHFKRDWVWLAPVLLIGISFSLYENPWLKLISVFLLPIVIGIFCAYSHFDNRETHLWNRTFLMAIGSRLMVPFSMPAKAVAYFEAEPTVVVGESHSKILTRVILGLAILLPLSLVVVLLLSSADAQFGDFVLDQFHSLLATVSWLTVLKFLFSILLSVVLLSIAVGWRGTVAYGDNTAAKPVDGLVAGIVLSGLLVIYVAFLVVQFDHLVIEQLPQNYHEAERMVKSGFWQLFILAVLNTALFFVVYRKTGPMAQWVLRVFIIGSSLLMVSAAWKVGLYSYTFGLSYEKFFACYTAIFALGVLLYLVVASFARRRRNAVKSIAFAALWGYALATVSPVERLIFRGNLFFSEQPNTRIALHQSTQLSLDVLPDVNAVYDTILSKDAIAIAQWRVWRQNQINVFCHRPWFELNLSVASVCR